MPEDERVPPFGNAPDHQAGEASVYVSTTVDSGGHPRGVEVEAQVPDAAEGSRPFHLDLNPDAGHDADPGGPDTGWPPPDPSLPPSPFPDDWPPMPGDSHAPALPDVPDVQLEMPLYEPHIEPAHLPVPELHYELPDDQYEQHQQEHHHQHHHDQHHHDQHHEGHH